MIRAHLRTAAFVCAYIAAMLLVIALGWWGAQVRPSLIVEHFFPSLITDESWRRLVAKDPTAHGYSVYGILQDRGSRVAVSEATRDLRSTDPYVWLNAALYLGELGEPVAVPYLIKGLRHPAHRAHDEAAAHLRSITGQTFGTNFPAWKNWWESQNPGTTFDFEVEP